MSSSPVSPPQFDFDSPAPGTAASSPLPSSTAASSPPANALSEYSCASSEVGTFDVGAMEEDELRAVEEVKKEVEEVLATEEEQDSETTRRLSRLQFVLKKSAVYSTILKERMDEDKARQLEQLQARRHASKIKSKSTSASTSTKSNPKTRNPHAKHAGQKRTRAETDSESDSEAGGKRKKGLRGEVVSATAPAVEEEDAEEEQEADEEEDDDDESPIFQQPALITGAKLKSYQLEGLQWMVSLDQNGISGILADEMGLGKTLQTIAFSAYLKEQHNSKPFLVVCPLSVLHNWVDEYKKFAPDIPVCMYHGTPAERAELRRTVMALPGSQPATKAKPRGRPPKGKGAKGKGKAAKGKSKASARSSTGGNASASARSSMRALVKPSGRATRAAGKVHEEEEEEKVSASSLRRSTRARKSIVILDSDSEEEEQEATKKSRKGKRADEEYREVIDVDELSDEDEAEEEEDEDEEDEAMDVDDSLPSSKPTNDDDPFASFPIVLTTYEMIIKDRAQLAQYNWGYIVVDEGHRLKNLDCKLMKEIKKYRSAGRMILTGTPLHNNLAELWSLLNFILPDIFDDIDSFQEWFNLPSLQSSLPTSQSSQIISSLHAILKPFLLRRLKTDVETSLPPKKEYVLYAPLSVRQREAYENVLGGDIRRWLIDGGTADGVQAKKAEMLEVKEEEGSKEEGKGKRGKMTLRRRKGGKKNYAVDGDDDKYFEMLQRKEEKPQQTDVEREREESRIGREHQLKTKVKQVNNMKLQNTVMQLRKVCSHPFLFDWPIDGDTLQPVLGEELVNASGKMMVLDRLLRELFRRKHKVLLFSQFTTMLDIIEDWATEYMGWTICRIDGSSGPLERREEMNRFQTGGDAPDAPCLFLLSTRAGGLGINLVAADTVIFYDQDWNPQMDAQAQDRAHRIGQTKPVLIFRLVSAHTIETKIMQRATEKRKLEALVIAKGKFKMPASAAPAKKETIAEMAATLLRLEGEKIEVVPNTKEGKASVLSDEDLEILLDRSDAVFAERQQGWTSSKVAGEKVVGAGKVEEAVGKKAAFAVYQAPREEGNDALAKMMGEEIPE